MLGHIGLGRIRSRSLHISKVLFKGSKTETAASIGIALGFLGLGLRLQLSTSFYPGSLFGNGQRVLIMENKCTLAGIPIVMKLGGVHSCPTTRATFMKMSAISLEE